MDRKILAPLGQNDRSEEMIAYIENVARPGMKVIFLVRYPVDGFMWTKEEFGMKVVLEAKKLVTHYSWEAICREQKGKSLPPARLCTRKASKWLWMFTPGA